MYTIDLRPEVKTAIMATIKNMLDGYPLDSHTIEVEPDDFGGEGIFIHLNYDKSVQIFPASLAAKMRSTVRKQLIEIDEYRFPFISHHFQPQRNQST